MAQIFTISDNDSDPSEDQEKTEQTQDNSESSQPSQCLAVPERFKAERHRNLSVNETMEDEDPLVDSFRPRSRSAPPLLWAAKKYGQQLRRMSDEFANLLDKGANMRRVESVGTPRQMRQSPSWLALLWSHKESEAESRPAE